MQIRREILTFPPISLRLKHRKMTAALKGLKPETGERIQKLKAAQRTPARKALIRIPEMEAQGKVKGMSP